MMNETKGANYIQQPACQTWVRLSLIAILCILGIHAGSQSAFAGPPVIFTLSDQATGAEIQKALDSLPANGEVRLKPGTYEISEPLMLRHDGVTLRGSGPSTILHLVNGADCPVVILGPPIAAKHHIARHLRLADLMIDGNRKNQKLEFWRSAGDGSEVNNNGVQIWSASDAAVEHVICCRCRSGGLVTAGVSHLVINDFDSFDNQFDGLACYETEDSQFSGLRLHDNLAAGISLDLDFDHNSITNAVLTSNDLGIFMRHSNGNRFRKLTISKSRHHGVFMAEASAPTPKGWQLCPGTACIGNDFQNLNIDDCGGKAFQVNDSSCTNNSILQAIFLHNVGGGLSQPATNPVSFRQVAVR